MKILCEFGSHLGRADALCCVAQQLAVSSRRIPSDGRHNRMVRHLNSIELDRALRLHRSGLSAVEVREKLDHSRKKKDSNDAAPHVANIRLLLRGRSYKRGNVETRGRPLKLTPRKVRKLLETRARMVKEADGEYEVTYDMIRKRARIRASISRMSEKFKEKGCSWRPQRKKPRRTKKTEAKRVAKCKKWKFLPTNFFRSDAHMIIDLKKFEVPTSASGRKHLRKLKVRGTHRLRKEGLKDGHTKPCTKRNRQNVGSHVHIAAGVCKGRIKMWHEVRGRWNGEAAKRLYEGATIATLKKEYPTRADYVLYEDNDPSGLKSSAGLNAKRAMKIRTVDTPTYSPDLNPLDFALWKNVEDRVLKQKIEGRETRDEYVARLRRFALRTPTKTVIGAVLKMKRRLGK